MFSKKLIIFLIFFMLTISAVFSFDFYYSSSSMDPLMFFKDETSEYLKIINDGGKQQLFISSYLDYFYNYEEDFQILHNSLFAYFFRINEYFFIPLSFTFQINSIFFSEYYDDFWEYLENDKSYEFDYSYLFFNTGIVFQHRFGNIGLFAGYNFDIVNIIDILDPFFTEQNFRHRPEDYFYYSIFGILNTKDIPIIGYMFKQLSASFIFNNKQLLRVFSVGSDNISVSNSLDDELDLSFRFSFTPFDIGSVSISRLEPYFNRKPNNLVSYKNEYGLFSNVSIGNNFSFFLDIGYIDYFNVIQKSVLYEDTPFIRFGFPVNSISNKNEWVGFSLYMDKAFIVPKIGIFASQKKNSFMKGAFLVELGFYRVLSLSAFGSLSW